MTEEYRLRALLAATITPGVIAARHNISPQDGPAQVAKRAVEIADEIIREVLRKPYPTTEPVAR